MLVGGFLEFIIGNTFPFVVFMSFGAFWLTLAATLQPFYNAYGAYAPPGSPSIAAGLTSEGFNASFGFFLVFMAVLCLIYLVCSLRTNVVFVVIFLTLVVAFSLLGTTYFYNAQGNAALAHRTLVVGLRPYLLTWLPLANIYLGCWCDSVCNVNGRLVVIRSYHACCIGFPITNSSGRSFHNDQRRK